VVLSDSIIGSHGAIHFYKLLFPDFRLSLEASLFCEILSERSDKRFLSSRALFRTDNSVKL